MKRPKIGVSPLYDTTRPSKWRSLWMFPGYIEGIIKAGGLPFILPLTGDEQLIEEAVSECDGFLLTGGQDIDPEIYGEPLYDFCGTLSPERDSFELLLFEKIQKQNKAVLGICRGLQLINIAMGGTLYQDLKTQFLSGQPPLQHDQQSDFIHPVHDVIFEKKSRLSEIMGVSRLRVNSMHHQGIAKLGKGINVAARGTDGLIEAIEIENLDFGVAVQWHPEFLWPEHSEEYRLFEALVQASV